MTQEKKKSYQVLTGINFPPGKRAEAGDIRDDIPAQSIPWLLEQGHIKPAKKGK